MEEKVYFQSKTTHDLSVNKEFSCFNRLNSTRPIIMRTIVCLFLCYLVYFTSEYTYKWLLLPYCLIFVVGHVVTWFSLRNGSKYFKQSLVMNQGKPITNVISLTEESIRCVNADNGNIHQYQYAYEHLHRIWESKNLLILIFKNNLAAIIDKRNLTGGTTEDFTHFLYNRCPNLKKKVQKGIFGKVMAGLYVFVLATVILISILRLPMFSDLSAKLTGKIPDSASYSEIVVALEELGITGCDDAVLRRLEESSSEYASYYNNSYYRTLELLCWLGMGEYNDITWEWTPSESGVYWFDAEVYDMEFMYTNFLKGVSALDDELDFQICKEWSENENWQMGTGDQLVYFTWNGTVYTLKGQLYYDWFDFQVANDLNKIIRDANTGKQLYFAYDGGQGVLVFYRDAQWAKEFQYKTGIELHTDPNSVF